MTLKAAIAANKPSPRDGAKTRGEPGPEAARHRPLNDEHVHRSDGGRHQHANAKAGKHELKGG